VKPVEVKILAQLRGSLQADATFAVDEAVQDRLMPVAWAMAY
jgi:hypothetical protein